jgi:hypothetical protein
MSNWGKKNITRDPRLTRANMGQGNGVVFRVSTREFFGHTNDKQPALSGPKSGSGAVTSRVQHSAWKFKNITFDKRIVRVNLSQINGLVFRISSREFLGHTADKQPALSGATAGSGAVVSRVQTSRWKRNRVTFNPRTTRHTLDKSATSVVRNISRAQFFGNVIKAATGSGGVAAGSGALFSLALSEVGAGGAVASGSAAFNVTHLVTGAGGPSAAGMATVTKALHVTFSGGVSTGSGAIQNIALQAVGAGTVVAGGADIAHIGLVATGKGGPEAGGAAVASIGTWTVIPVIPLPKPRPRRDGVGGHHWIPDTGLIFPEPEVVEEQEPEVARGRVGGTIEGMRSRAKASVRTYPMKIRATLAPFTLSARAKSPARMDIQHQFGRPELTVSGVRVTSQGKVDPNAIGALRTSMIVKHEVFSAAEMAMIMAMLIDAA